MVRYDRPVELNAPDRLEPEEELTQYLLTASNVLYLYENACLKSGRPVPEGLRRAHRAIRNELERAPAGPAA